MTGMLLKDFYLSRSMSKTYLLLIALFFGLTVAGVYASGMFSALFAMLLVMIPINTFAYDEQASWDKYAVATPSGRRGVVGSKYLFTLLMAAGCLVVSLPMNLLIFLLGRNISGDFFQSWLISIGCIGAGVLMNAVTMPLVFQFGSQKSRVGLIIVVATVTAGAVAMAAIADESPISLNSLAFLLPVGAVLLFVASYFITLRIFEKKEL